MEKNKQLQLVIISLLGVAIVIAIFSLILKNNTPLKNSSNNSNSEPSPTPKEAPQEKPVRVFQPQQGETVSSPLQIRGEARGIWYFEASFPVKIADAAGKILGQAPAQAQGEWMTKNFVPFELTLIFESPGTDTGEIIFEKDNPSGLPEYADELRIPIHFSKTPSPTPVGNECRATGCSGQVCSDTDASTTCEYRAEYACYKTAKCERQSSGACGWTLTEELNKCLNENKNRALEPVIE